MNETPCFRKDLEFIPIQHEGQQLVMVRDQLGLIPEGQAMAPEFFQLLTLFNGTRTLCEVQATLVREAGGQLLDSDVAQRIQDDLDGAFLLDSARYREARDHVVQEYAHCSERACALVGRTYPEDPARLRTWLDVILAAEDDAALPDVSDGAAAPLKALVAPHIDPPVGAVGYAAAYKLLRVGVAAPEIRRVVALGIGHSLTRGLFALTSKDFHTPLGVLRNASEEVAALRDAGRGCLAANDFAHRSEHSIEFQALFLQHLLPADSFSLVPILCGSLLHGLPVYTRQAFRDAAGPFLEQLASLAAAPDTLIVAGVDFAHVGPKFGHKESSRALEAEATAHDKELLDCLVRGDAAGFWATSAAVRDRYNVCGFAALATLLEILPPVSGRALYYRLWHEQPTDSAVGFAAAAFSSI